HEAQYTACHYYKATPRVRPCLLISMEKWSGILRARPVSKHLSRRARQVCAASGFCPPAATAGRAPSTMRAKSSGQLVVRRAIALFSGARMALFTILAVFPATRRAPRWELTVAARWLASRALEVVSAPF